MKYTLVIAMMLPFFAHSQCTNVYGRIVDCPTVQDSLVLYNNAIKVQEFFENNKLYAKTRTVKIVNEDEKRDIFNKLQQARSIFVLIRKEKLNAAQEEQFASTKPNPNYKDITYRDYYHEIDEYRFYQRELENQIVNKEAPAPIYDNRVCPVVVNEYKCVDSASVFFGDIVNIPLYIPVIVKPAAMLTSSEKITREEILKNDYNIPAVPSKPKQTLVKAEPVKPVVTAPVAVSVAPAPEMKVPVKTDVVIPEVKKEAPPVAVIPTVPAEKPVYERKGLPVYYFNGAGSGSIIGFMDNGNFRKVRREEYKELMVMKYAQDLLENEEKFKTWIRIQYGGYCVAVR